MDRSCDYTKDTGYVDIHGNDIRISVCNKTGGIFIPLDELKKSGFNIYRKSQFNKLLIDDDQINQEFQSYMLGCAQTYMLKNREIVSECAIIDNINRVKEALARRSKVLNVATPSQETPATKPAHYRQQDYAKMLTPNHSVQTISPPTPSRSQNMDIRVTAQDEPLMNRFSSTPSPTLSANSFNMNRRSENRNGFIEKNELRKPQTNVHSRVGDLRESPPALPTIQLSKSKHKVLVSFVEKPNVIWVQDLENVDTLVKIDTLVKDEVAKGKRPVMATGRDKIYIAQDEGLWFRCKMIRFKPPTVFFIDYGNTAVTSNVCEMSEALAKIPCQATKIFLAPNSKCPELYSIITVKIHNRANNGSKAEIVADEDSLDDFTDASNVETPTHPLLFFTKPDSICKLENSEKIMVIGSVDNKLVVRTKQANIKFRQVEKMIKATSTEDKIENLQQNQLVLCQKGNCFVRGVIAKIDGMVIHVELLDHHETIPLKKNALRLITQELSLVPITYCVTPPIKNFVDNDLIKEYIKKIVTDRVKGTAILHGRHFDLKLSSGLLSEHLTQLNLESGRTMLDKMTKYRPNLGVGAYGVFTFHSSNDLTLLAQESFDSYLGVIVKMEIESNKAYEAIVGEVCYGTFEGSWYRAVILRQDGANYSVKFIDFGNVAQLKKDELRKLTDDAVKAPVLGITCRLIGLPHVKGCEQKLAEMMLEGETYEFDMKNINDDCCEAEIPEIYRQLRQSL